MPIVQKDSKFVHCTHCNQKFRFEYEANKHEHEQHPDKQQPK